MCMCVSAPAGDAKSGLQAKLVSLSAKVRRERERVEGKGDTRGTQTPTGATVKRAHHHDCRRRVSISVNDARQMSESRENQETNDEMREKAWESEGASLDGSAAQDVRV